MWKTIEDFPDYQVSNMGKVKSLKREQIKILKPRKTSNGYFAVSLSNGITSKNYRIHRLVAESFVPNKHNKPFINHKDLNKTNNKVANLEWVSQKENVYHAFKAGKHPKLAIAVRCIETGGTFSSVEDAEKTTGVPATTIFRCLTNRKTARGFSFERVI